MTKMTHDKMTKSISSRAHRWGIILAGGDGTRLLPMTRRINGDDRPKQFSAVLGGETLLDQTRRRVAEIVDPCRTLLSLTAKHEPFFRKQAAAVPEQLLLIQPYNHGTAQAILFSLMRLRKLDPDATVAYFPSDHYFANGSAFTRQIQDAFGGAERRPPNVVLLGIEADAPEESYGWIEPGGCLGKVFAVTRFWEKPSRTVAASLLDQGCLWNSFVMVGRVSAFLELFRNTMPELLAAFEARQQHIGTSREHAALTEIYNSTAAGNFSTQVLSTQTRHLSVLPGRNLGWSDLGEPNRVSAVQERVELAYAQTA